MAPINHRKPVKISCSEMLTSYLLHMQVPHPSEPFTSTTDWTEFVQRGMTFFKTRSTSQDLISTVPRQVVLGFPAFWVCVNVEPMWFWWFGSNVYQMTTQRLPKLNNPEVILWLGSNLLSREPQVDSQIAASVQNSLQETRAGRAQCCDFFFFLLDTL